MKRISKMASKIANAHIKARRSGEFDVVSWKTPAELLTHLINGKVIEDVLDEVEVRFLPTTTNILSSVFKYTSQTYGREVRRGFNQLLSNVNYHEIKFMYNGKPLVYNLVLSRPDIKDGFVGTFTVDNATFTLECTHDGFIFVKQGNNIFYSHYLNEFTDAIYR